MNPPTLLGTSTSSSSGWPKPPNSNGAMDSVASASPRKSQAQAHKRAGMILERWDEDMMVSAGGGTVSLRSGVVDGIL